MDKDPLTGVHRRVVGYHDYRMDGMTDLLLRARGRSVLDIGCNRGMVAFEFANNGARICHGCDIDDECINVARGTFYEAGANVLGLGQAAHAQRIFADIRNCEAQFEVIDLTKRKPLKPFGVATWDIILLLAVVHKLQRKMPAELLDDLLVEFARRANEFIAGTGEEGHIQIMDEAFKANGFEMVQWSKLSIAGPNQCACIWFKHPK